MKPSDKNTVKTDTETINSSQDHAGDENSPIEQYLAETRHLLESFTNCRVLIVGDVMLDEYLTGDAERISPEAPVPVVHVTNENSLLGGAGNVARNIRALRGQTTLIGVRGNDIAGQKLISALADGGVDTVLHTMPNRPTTVKTRIMARMQQVVRVDREDISEHDAQTTQAILKSIEYHLPLCQCVIISDYGKGLVSSLFMKEFMKLVSKDGRHIPVLVDPKPQNIDLYKGVTLLTPNAKETSESVNMPVKTLEQILHAGRAFMSKAQSPHLLTTLGPMGMAVFTSKDSVWHIPTTAQQVYDVTGAGDTVIATTALSLAAGAPLVQACILANYAAGIVVSEVGAATATPDQLIEAIASLPKPQIQQL